MRKYSSKADANQTEIVKALRAVGASVFITSNVAKGFPDLVVGYNGINYLVEIKDGKKQPSEQKLKPHQIELHASWRGQICVVNSVEQALKVIGL
jgi:Holliday junction resolvase - archaeal type